jgi:hypothetical protein
MELQLACATQADSIFTNLAGKVSEALRHMLSRCVRQILQAIAVLRDLSCWYLWLHWYEQRITIATAVA